MVLLAALSVLIFVPFTGVGAVTCSAGWSAFGSACYSVVPKNFDWFDAQSTCTIVGDGLVEIDSSEENAFVASLLAQKNASRAWIGLYDFIEEEGYKWIRTNTEPTFTSWEGAAPTSDLADDCVEIDYSGYWNDASCIEELFFVCEKSPGSDAIVG